MAIGLQDIRRLTSEVGARPPGSSAEREMAYRIAERLNELGVPNTILHFRTVRGTATLYLVPFVGLLLSIGVAWFNSLAGLICATVFALLTVLEATNRPIVSRLFRLDSSQNVIGLVPNRPPRGHEDEGPLRRVILSAPLDSPRIGWLDSPLMQRIIQPLTLLVLLSVLAIPALLAVYLFLEEPLALAATGIPGLIVFLALVFIMQRDVAGAVAPGRNHNASGIVTALAVAEELMRYPPLTVETLLVFTGASQSGSAGMTDFLGENKFNAESTYFVNVQGVGRGPVCFTRAEGPILALQSSPALVHIAGDLALSHPQRLMRPIIQRGMLTEQYAALIRGYQAMTVMGHPDPRQTDAPPGAIENDEIDPSAIESAYILAHGIIRRLDEEALANGMPHSRREG